MIIDVYDPSLNLILNACFFIILGFGLISIIPWKLKDGGNRWTLILPIPAILIYVAYELAMPSNWDIRIDLLLVWPVLVLILLLCLVRGILIWRHNSRSHGTAA